MVEYDEAYVTKATLSKQKKKLSRGRGSQQKCKVAVMDESTVLEDFKKGEFNKSCRYFKMKKIDNLKAKTEDKLVKDLIDKEAMLQTDDSTTFANLEMLSMSISQKFQQLKKASSTSIGSIPLYAISKVHLENSKWFQKESSKIPRRVLLQT